MGQLEDELARVRAKQRAATAGLHGKELFEAMIRAGGDHAIANLDPSLAQLEEALGIEVDPGDFILAMFVTSFAINEIDVVAAAKLPAIRELMLEYMERARALR